MVPVQMIRRDIQDRAYLRAERMYRLKLEAADLRHDHGVRRRLRNHARIWSSDVAHNKDALFIVLHDLPEKGRRRRLAVSSRDRQDISPAEHIGKLDLSPDRDPTLSHTFHDRQVCRHARAHNYKREPVQ